MKLAQADFERLARYMKSTYGINLEKKPSLIEGRLGTVIAKKGFTDFHTYIDYALKNPEEIMLLVSRLSTNYSYFMREEQHYKFLTEVALPEWVPRITDRDLRIWSAGCSSGEEAYTTAMVVNDFLGAQASEWDATILATDISENVLAQGRRGVYPEEELKLLSPKYKKQNFTLFEPGLYEVVPQLRKQVVFGNFNLMEKTFNFRKKFHVIFCRNVMIYFDNPTREALVDRFYQCLHPGGYMFIGMSETMSSYRNRFEYIMPAIYRRGVRT